MTGEKTDAILAKNRAILTFLKGGKDTPQWTTQKITGISWFRACVPLSTEGIRAGRTEVWDTAMEIAGVEI